MVNGSGRVKVDENDGMLTSFIACIRGERAKPESTLEDGVAAVKVMNAAYESISQNKVIELKCK